jgi:hypothetical protein
VVPAGRGDDMVGRVGHVTSTGIRPGVHPARVGRERRVELGLVSSAGHDSEGDRADDASTAPAPLPAPALLPPVQTGIAALQEGDAFVIEPPGIVYVAGTGATVKNPAG